MSSEDISYSLPDIDEVIDFLGKGGYGKVHLVMHEDEILARKEVKYDRRNELNVESSIHEIELLKELKHRNVVELVDSFIDTDKNVVYIYTKYYENGDLWRLIDEKRKKKLDFSICEIVNYMKDLISGLKYVHSKNILHRDLNPTNILVGDENELVISGFGLALENRIVDIYLTGTPNYIAPELCFTKPPSYSTSSDIFSLGCILYELYTLRMAFDGKDDREVIWHIIHSNYLNFERMNGERIALIEELISKMLEKDVNKRIELYEIEERIAQLSLSYEQSIQQLQHSSSYSSFSSISSYYDGCRYCSLTVDLYLNDGYIAEKSLREISEMNEEEFNSFWNDDYIPILFPSINQDNPPFSYNDSIILTSNRYKFLPYLTKLFNLLKRIKERKKEQLLIYELYKLINKNNNDELAVTCFLNDVLFSGIPFDTEIKKK